MSIDTLYITKYLQVSLSSLSFTYSKLKSLLKGHRLKGRRLKGRRLKGRLLKGRWLKRLLPERSLTEKLPSRKYNQCILVHHTAINNLLNVSLLFLLRIFLPI